MESFFHTLKADLIHGKGLIQKKSYVIQSQAILTIFIIEKDCIPA